MRRLYWWFGLWMVLSSAPSIALNGVLQHAPYELCFTPGHNCTQLIVHTILSAKKTVHVQAYSFTSKPIIHALEKVQASGVKVFVLLDKSNIGMPYSVIRALDYSHIPYLIDYQPEIAHNKVMIIDNNTVITGSFNFTKAAQYYYAENVLVIHNAALAAAYSNNFKKRQSVSEAIKQFCHPITPDNAIMCHQQMLFSRQKS